MNKNGFAYPFIVFSIGFVIVLTFIILTPREQIEQAKKNAMTRTRAKNNNTFEHCITEVTYKGHQYLMYDKHQTHMIVHDPDCPCITNNQIRLYQAISTK